MMTASAYHVISKEVENRIFRHNRTFRHTFMYQQPTLTSSGIITFLCKYYIVISDTLISSWMSFFFARCKPRRKDWVTEKVHRRIRVRHILSFFHLLPPFHLLLFYVKIFFFVPDNGVGRGVETGALCLPVSIDPELIDHKINISECIQYHNNNVSINCHCCNFENDTIFSSLVETSVVSIFWRVLIINS